MDVIQAKREAKIDVSLKNTMTRREETGDVLERMEANP
jgi:hypothetical protein